LLALKKVLLRRKFTKKNIGIAKQTSQHLFLLATPVEFCGDSNQCVWKGFGERGDSIQREMLIFAHQ
jgi:hypothetical protein